MKYKETLNLIYSNDVILDSLKSFFMETAEKSRPTVHGQDDDTLGQEYRAFEKAKEIISDTFFHLKSLQSADQSSQGLRYK